MVVLVVAVLPLRPPPSSSSSSVRPSALSKHRGSIRSAATTINTDTLRLSSVHYSSNRPPHSLTLTHAGVIIYFIISSVLRCLHCTSVHTDRQQQQSSKRAVITKLPFSSLTSLAVHAAASAAALCCHTHTTATATVSFCLSFSFLSFHPLHSFYQESEWKNRHWRQLPERQSAIAVLCSRHAVSFSLFLFLLLSPVVTVPFVVVRNLKTPTTPQHTHTFRVTEKQKEKLKSKSESKSKNKSKCVYLMLSLSKHTHTRTNCFNSAPILMITF